jgi:spermidine synthase
MDRYSIPFAITALGISHVITQITVIREFINIFTGNEIIVGILISLWLLLTGFGAWLGRYIRSSSLQTLLFRISLFIVALLPLFHIVLIRLLRNSLFTRGELPGLGQLILWATVLLLPYCIITGGLLTVACSILPAKGSGGKSIGRVYFFDNIGDILGGVLFSFFLVKYFNNLELLYVPALLCLSGFLISGYRKLTMLILGTSAVVAVLIFIGSVPLDKTSLKWLYPLQKIVDYSESPYGRLVVTKDREQISFFENGEHLFSTPNIFASEEMVHFALPQLDRINSVLLVSGGISGIIDEITKYGVRRLDYVEIDPQIISTGVEKLTIHFPNAVHIHLEDGRKFIQKTGHTYDAVILNLPDPVSLQLNRFYTCEFFQEVKTILNTEGIVCFGVRGAENYISEDQASLLSTLYNSLKGIFRHVLIIPGERNIFIASDKPLTYNIAPLITSKDIKTTYINEHYLRGWVTSERVAFVNESLIDDIAPNHDFHPAAYLYTMRVWLGMFQENYLIPVIVALLFLIFYFLRTGAIQKVIFSTGFIASSMEVTILLVYQILHGSVYTGIGLVIAAFMAGLALGSYTSNRMDMAGKRSLLKIEVMIIIYLFVFTLMLFLGKELLGSFVLALLALIIGTLTGAEFPIAGRVLFSTPEKTAGSLYTADLLGGSLGAFVIGVFLIPLLGIYTACFFLIVLKALIAAGLLVTIRNRA